MKVKAFVFAGLALVLVGVGVGNWIAQAPTWEWARTFGGRENDFGFSVQQTSDGGYILLGSTESFSAGESDIWLIKNDAVGNKLWDKTFGGSGDDKGWSVQETADGGYILLGYTYSFGAGKSDVWLIKTDATGNLQWEKTFGGCEGDEGASVQQTRDGGYILIGTTENTGWKDIWLIKTDAEGKLLWERTFGGISWDNGSSVQQTRDGGYILLGYTYSFGAGSSDFWLIKTDGEGNLLWERTFGERGWDEGYSVQQTSDGGYILLGYTNSFGVSVRWRDIWLIKTDGEGNVLWERTFDKRGDEVSFSVQQTRDGGYVLVGSTAPFDVGERDVWLIKTDGEGKLIWERTFGGRGLDWGSSVQQTNDDSYILLGGTESFGAGEADFWLIKYRP